MIFSLTGKELQNFLDWDRDHKKVCEIVNSNVQAAIGGRLTFSFTPTGLGSAVIVKCVCGEEFNCTDYGSW